MKPIKSWLVLFASTALLLGACEPVAEETDQLEGAISVSELAEEPVAVDKVIAEEDVEEETEENVEDVEEESERPVTETEPDEKKESPSPSATADEATPSFEGYRLIDVDGGDQSGHREANVVVDIGFGDRDYWAYTNEHGQLVRVVAETITMQNDDTEPVKSNGRYYHDEAKVPGVESDTLDEGHVIADSMGGVSNAYNITPQESTLNRHGDQAYMERNIRDAGGATNFEAVITYPNTTTHTPSHYKYTYTIRGNTVVDEYANVNPDKVNEDLGLTTPPKEDSKPEPQPEAKADTAEPANDVSKVDANSNGKVTIQEAKDAGFQMPIYKDHWLYPYMDDRDGDGSVGE